MSYFLNKYPYTDFHELNLDYVLAAIKIMKQELDEFINFNSIKFADPIEWNITESYTKSTVVIDNNTKIAYLSKQPVPAGVAITNEDYWLAIFDFSQFFESIGDLNELDTTAKDNLVNAINEIFNIVNFNVPFVTPDFYGAEGDGITDDTSAIKQAVDSGKVILLINRYVISERVFPTNDIIGYPGSELIVDDNADINPIKITTDNIVLEGLTITGNKETYPDTPSHYAHGIYINGNNVEIRHCTIRNTTGDGIYFGGDRTLSNVKINSCVIDGCSRNGISAISAKEFKILNTDIYNIAGAGAPECGIDIEPNDENEEFHGQIIGCTTHSCNRAGISLGLFNIGDSKICDVMISDFKSDGDGVNTSDQYAGSILVNDYIKTTGKVNVIIRNTNINNPITKSLFIRNMEESNGCTVDADIKVTNCALGEAASLYLKTNTTSTENVYNKLKITCDDDYTGYSMISRRSSSTENRGYSLDIESNKKYRNNPAVNPKVYFNTSPANPVLFMRYDTTLKYKSLTDCFLTKTTTGTYKLTTGADYNAYSIIISPQDIAKTVVTKVNDHEYTIELFDSGNTPIDTPFSLAAKFENI